MDLEVCTLEHFKKVKSGYTDQFNLDYNQLVKVFELNNEMKQGEDHLIEVPANQKIRNLNGGLLPSQVEQAKRVEKAERRKTYSDKVNTFYREPMHINRPETAHDKTKKKFMPPVKSKSSYCTGVLQ
jgi:hypothetical protein